MRCNSRKSNGNLFLSKWKVGTIHVIMIEVERAQGTKMLHFLYFEA